ncbi:hypothetical protein OF83DRAFT_1082162 [Amylostereum chailletii]|nr:hypothetical protein OF83DRAFT_1082162 [Amylostereum chailletii]
MWGKYKSYLSLPQNEEGESKENPLSRYGLLKTAVARWSIAVILLCTIIDSCALLYILSRLSSTSSPRGVPSSDDIPFRTSYINLDQIYLQRPTSSEPRRSIINIPQDIAQVTRTKPDQVYPQPSDAWVNRNGVVPFGYRHLLVDSETSTLAQFRVMDYGMGNCSITIRSPSKSTSVGNTAIEGDQGDAMGVDVWLLSTSRRLDLKTTSWAKKPHRAGHLGTLSLSPGTTQSLPGFPCYVNITEVHKSAIGLYMVQYQTI